ncbi:MAG: B12-binding domain-containing radical SAM protein [Terriglobales bacterium]
MTDILFTHANHVPSDTKQARKMQPYPPLSGLYAAALLRAAGHSVAFFDSTFEPPLPGLRSALARHRPRVLAICEDNFNFLSKMCLTANRQLAWTMAEMAHDAGVVVVGNSSDASDHVEEYLHAGFDWVVMGEPEQTLLELARALAQNPQQVTSIAGLAWLTADGRVARTPPRSAIAALDALPLPARDLVDIEPYRRAWRAHHGYFSLNLVASRGCPYGCNWCAKPIYGNAWHGRSAAAVAGEMHELRTRWGADQLWFADDVFALRPGWAEELAQAVQGLQAVTPFKIQTRANLISASASAALRRAGCREVWLGAESGAQEVLDRMDKGLRVRQVLEARAALAAQNIRAGFFLQFGYPGEGWAEIAATIALVRTARPDDIGVSVSYPLPGTGFHRQVRGQLGAKRNWSDSDDLEVMFQATYTSEFYRALRDALHAEVSLYHRDATAAGAARVGMLWQRVEALEPASRHPQPTTLARTAAG